MPSDKKRINLTVPDEIYEQLQAYKAESGISSDATVCLQLVVQQLKAYRTNQALLNLLQNSSVGQLQQMASEGVNELHGILNRDKT